MSLLGEKERRGSGFLVLGHDGKVLNAQERRSHVARVGYRRTINTSKSRAHISMKKTRYPASQNRYNYKAILPRGPTPPTTYRTSKQHTDEPLIPRDGPVPVEGNHDRRAGTGKIAVSLASNRQYCLRQPSLDMFPFKIYGQPKAAFAYYTEFTVPAAFRRNQFRGLTQDSSLLRDLIPFFLSNDVVFSAILARAILHYDVVHNGSSSPSESAIQAYGMAVRLLRKHLASSPDKGLDLVICAMMFLIAFDNASNGTGRALMHGNALTDVIMHRGGREKLGFDGWLAEASGSFILRNQAQQVLVQNDSKPVQKFNKLEPPNHPFSLRLCNQIAKLTPAFEHLCFHERLVEPVVNLLVQIKEWRDSAPTNKDCRTCRLSPSTLDANKENATTCFILLQNPSMPTSSQLIVMALQAYCRLVDEADRGWSRMAQSQVQFGIFDQDLRFNQATRNAAWLTWVAMLFLASSHTDALTSSMGMRLLDQQQPKRSWTDRAEICQSYFWEPHFLDKVLKNVSQLQESKLE